MKASSYIAEATRRHFPRFSDPILVSPYCYSTVLFDQYVALNETRFWAIMIPMVYGIAIPLMIAWITNCIVHIMALSYSKWKLHRPVDRSPPEVPYPGVSILKPLSGLDPNLYSNLETFFKQDYPMYELLFCVEDENDPSIVLVNILMNDYPHIDSRLFTGGCCVGVNPKINNMLPGYNAAKYSLILISDAGIRTKEDTLLDMVQHMSERVGIVHQMPFVADIEDGFPNICEKIFFGTSYLKLSLCADLLGINCHVGMSSLMAKTALEEVGGLVAFADYLAEDYFIADAMLSRGWKLRACSTPALQNTGARSLSAILSRFTRWAQLRLAMVPGTALLEPITQCIPVGIGAAWAFNILLNLEPLPFFLVHVLLSFLSDWLLLRAVQNGAPPFSKVQFVLGWLWTEFSSPLAFVSALLSREVVWKNHSYRLDWGGRTYEVKEKIKV